jgi:pyruvate formate lyase activating enzyme
MNFHGLKKVTLIDYPGKIACTVFSHGCTLRCPFCHNPELVIKPPDNLENISEKEFLDFLRTRENKLDGVVFTGGEPLVHYEQILPIIKKIKKFGLLVKIDTNGTFPDELVSLIAMDLVDFIAMDFKIDFDSYSIMGASDELIDKIENSYELITGESIPYEIRTTCVPGIHDENSLRAMGPTIAKASTYVLQNFIPNGTIDPAYKKVQPFTSEKMKSFLAIAQSFNPRTQLRDQNGG